MRGINMKRKENNYGGEYGGKERKMKENVYLGKN